MEIIEFKKSCILLEPDLMVQKFIIEGSSFFFDKVFANEEFEFKKEISNTLKVHIRDVIIVGSGKLGFSLKPDATIPHLKLYRFKKFDSDFELDNSSKKSDLDIAIISSKLFDLELENLYSHTGSYTNLTGFERNNFAKYILKGRFAVRLLPTDFPLTKEISAVQMKYRMKYGRDVNIEVYKSWYFFESYHRDNILNIRLNLIA